MTYSFNERERGAQKRDAVKTETVLAMYISKDEGDGKREEKKGQKQTESNGNARGFIDSKLRSRLTKSAEYSPSIACNCFDRVCHE